MPFQSIDITDWPWYGNEQMGTKIKRWMLDPQKRRWLFKERRNEHGEDWSEKLAAEIAQLIGVPHPSVELAVRNGKRGSISLDFLTDRPGLSLMHGNELLVQLHGDYPVSGENYRTNQHTVDRALAVLQQDFIHLGISPDRPAAIDSPRSEFIGYLMFDALIGNTDRHHENWAVIVIRSAASRIVEAELSPSFDHASCLGRELDDVSRMRRLSGSPNDPSIEKYLSKMDSRWYLNPGGRKRLTPLAAFQLAAQRGPDAAKAWLARLERLSPQVVDTLLADMPNSMSDAARQFTRYILLSNAERLAQTRFRP